MINTGLSEDEFGKILGEVFSPARAITSIEFLKGRETNLKEIARAFTSPGRHAFIYGDRGVGKTSLALTSAQIHQSSDGEPICVSCDSETTLFSLIKDIATTALARQTFQFERVVTTTGFSFKFLQTTKTKHQRHNLAPISVEFCSNL